MPLNQLRNDLATYAFPVFIFLIGKVQRKIDRGTRKRTSFQFLIGKVQLSAKEMFPMNKEAKKFQFLIGKVQRYELEAFASIIKFQFLIGKVQQVTKFKFNHIGDGFNSS